MYYYSADYIIPVTSAPIKEGVVVVNDEGVILDILDAKSVPKDADVKKFTGVIIPGFINTHCHLELSHMLGDISRNTGLVDFIGEVMSKRTRDEDTIMKAMKKADEMMFANGIQAVGDHVNSIVSSLTKVHSKIIYHTFVEIISLSKEESKNAEKIDDARDIEFHFDSRHSSITPHAPYSCSKELLKTFKKSVSENNILSIHNQESEEENKLFRYKTGDFLKFYERINYSLDNFKAQARNSIQSLLPLIPNRNRTILVHNTYTSLKDLDFIQRMEHEVVMCLCPKANIYIEGSLPKVKILQNNKAKIALGTDSLASNNTLSILEELKVLHEHFKDLDFLTTIKWATINGAEALGLLKDLGSIEKGKKPGLVLLTGMKNLKMNNKVLIERIV